MMDATGTASADSAAAIDQQDQPPVEAHEREQRAKRGRPADGDLTAHEILQIATTEWREQSALRGPIEHTSWPGVAFYYRRLSAAEKRRINELFRKSGSSTTVFIERALNSDGVKIFSQSHFADLENSATPEVIEEIVTQMANGSRTQLTDAELGKS